MSTETVRVFRIIEYVGPREWVEKTIEKSIHGRKDLGAFVEGGGPRYIAAATLGTYPEIMQEAAS